LTGENDTVENVLKLGSTVRPDDLPGVVTSLYQSVKAARKWSQISEMKKEENDESIVRLVCKIVLFSCERPLGRLLWGASDSESESEFVE
jgi:hypothetical protein